MPKIVQLDKNLINQIAAGEVIERPSSVVKELVENSIDAGATRISVSVENECRNIRVADNGCGIDAEDITLAFSKHATSKIKNVDDLYSIHTLGFRGEALASIISISKVFCTTKTKEAESGTRVECQNSEVKSVKTGCADGTIMDIRDLFYNVPARLKFLKSEKTEFSYISDLITTLSIANPDVSFELLHNGKTALKTIGKGGLSAVINNLFSKEVADNMREVLKTDKISHLQLSGCISVPSFTRSSKKDYYLYVNGRAVKCPVFQRAIDTAYRNTMPQGRYPFVILKLDMPAEDVDVNVHPTKKEVRYKNPNQIFNFIMTSVTGALANNSFSLQNQTPAETSPQRDGGNENIVSFSEYIARPQTFEIKNDEEIFVSTADRISPEVFKPHREEPVYNKAPEITQREFIPRNTVVELRKEENIIGQYRKTYILIERDEGLEIVDQHIAEERYIYEKLKAAQQPSSQLLFISDVLAVSPEDMERLKENKAHYEKYGYGIEFLNEKEVTFKKLPASIAGMDAREILDDLLENLQGDVNGIEEKILIMTSCKSAVKANTPLNLFQMQEIIRNWRTCKQPYTCPHGRPISKILKHEDIAKFFMRNV